MTNPMERRDIELIITLKDGSVEHIDPVLNFTVYNGHGEYDHKAEDIASIEINELTALAEKENRG